VVIATLIRVQAWLEDPKHKWRSWFSHAAVVLAGGKLINFDVSLGWYFAREAEQAWDKQRRGEQQDVRDNIMDVLTPLVIVVVVLLLGRLLGRM
jgi:hypothetical protein